MNTRHARPVTARVEEVYRSLVQDGFPGGYAVNDSAALHFVDEQLADVVASVPGRTAFTL